MANLANLLTGVRMFGTPVLVLYYLNQRYDIAFWLMLFLGITDWFDGFFARKLNQETSFGRIFDPIADKILMVGMFITLGHLKAMPMVFISLCLARDILILLGGIVMAWLKNIKDLSPTKISKINTFLQILCILVVTYRLHSASNGDVLHFSETTLIAITSVFTIISGGQYAKTFWIFLKSR